MKSMIVMLGLFSCLQVFSKDKLLVISDVDDTIKISHIKNKKAMLTYAFSSSSVFLGMQKLYQNLLEDNKQSELYYVTNAYQFISKRTVKDMLVENQFPQKPIYFNSGKKHKLRTIKNLIEKHKPTTLVLIGDNGQQDFQYYKQIESEFTNIEVFTYLRYAYPYKNKLYKGQMAFVTTAELAADLYHKKIISEESYNSVVSLIYTQIQKPPTKSIFGKKIFPHWQDCYGFIWETKTKDKRLQLIGQKVKRRCSM